jgi:aerobic carbon-monoxide dehydrogenase medium subunit
VYVVRDFEFLEPTSVHDASAMLAEYGDECRIIAGGTALVLALRQRMVNPTHLISIGQIERARGITYDKKVGLRIGALTLHAEVAASPVIRKGYPMLADMAARVADPQVRNQGTIGGNLCYADPATDPPSSLMANDARLVLASKRGERILTIEEFLVDYYTTALEPDEIVTEIQVPPVNYTVGRHVRHLRTAAEHRPMINVAVTVKQNGRQCDDVRLVVGATTPVPARVKTGEDFLRGKAVTVDVAAEAAQIVATSIRPISDMRGSESYRRRVVATVVRRTICEMFGLEPS